MLTSEWRHGTLTFRIEGDSHEVCWLRLSDLQSICGHKLPLRVCLPTPDFPADARLVLRRIGPLDMCRQAYPFVVELSGFFVARARVAWWLRRRWNRLEWRLCYIAYALGLCRLPAHDGTEIRLRTCRWFWRGRR